jgi:hypothetical protein
MKRREIFVREFQQGRGSVFACILLFVGLHSVPASAGVEQFDVIVVGGTPGGIASAVAAARLGHTVGLVEYHHHLGGMAASGLGKSDIHTRSAIAGLFTEFTKRVYDDYVTRFGESSEAVQQCRNGYYYEPSVAERIFGKIVAEEKLIRLYLGHRLNVVLRNGRRVVGIRAIHRPTGEEIELRSRVFIDATYEGDLAAFAGARYRLGREGRLDFNEPHAGVIYMDHRTWTLLSGSTGEGDRKLPAYTYRLCLSTDPANSVSVAQPPDYDRKRYLNYFEDLKLRRIRSVVQALSIAPLPNGKTDVNMKPWPLGFPFAGENFDYAEADWEERERIMDRIRNITLGLLYFLQNDSQVPEADRLLARTYGLAKDEFIDNGHFPWQLYVREARRVVGLYTIRQQDLMLARNSKRAPVHHDAVAAAAFPIDSFPTRKHEAGQDRALEGYLFMMRNITRPYQIPYRAIVPENVDGLLVPVPLSATHVAFSAIRMEPTWMAIGQAAGTAAHLSITRGQPLRHLPIEALQRLLLENGQVITHFDDRTQCGEFSAAVQFFGTKGFFDDYQARPMSGIERSKAAGWMHLALKVAGTDIRMGIGIARGWHDFQPGSDNFAAALGLALAGVIEPANAGTNFKPQEQLTVGEFTLWLAGAGRLLGLWSENAHESNSAAATLETNGLGTRKWCLPEDEPLNPHRAIRRVEVCQALFLLLKKASS